jgi:hypothetical protein
MGKVETIGFFHPKFLKDGSLRDGFESIYNIRLAPL